MTDDLVTRLCKASVDDLVKTLLFEAAEEIFGKEDIPASFLRALGNYHFNEAAYLLKPEGCRMMLAENQSWSECILWLGVPYVDPGSAQTAKTAAIATAAASLAAHRSRLVKASTTTL